MSVPHFDFTTEHGLAPIPGAESPPLHTGDPHDDDARVIDSLVESEARPPTPEKLPQEKNPEVRPPEVPATRLVTSSIVFPATAGGTWDAVQLFPADPKRIGLRLSVMSATATDYVRFADDAGKLFADTSSFLLQAGGTGSIDIAHTGPVWVKLATGTGPVTVSGMAVTHG